MSSKIQITFFSVVLWHWITTYNTNHTKWSGCFEISLILNRQCLTKISWNITILNWYKRHRTHCFISQHRLYKDSVQNWHSEFRSGGVSPHLTRFRKRCVWITKFVDGVSNFTNLQHNPCYKLDDGCTSVMCNLLLFAKPDNGKSHSRSSLIVVNTPPIMEFPPNIQCNKGYLVYSLHSRVVLWPKCN